MVGSPRPNLLADRLRGDAAFGTVSLVLTKLHYVEFERTDDKRSLQDLKTRIVSDLRKV